MDGIKFLFSGGVPMILRDLLFYLIGYIFGVKGMTTHDCLDLYKHMQIENKVMNFYREKKKYLAEHYQERQRDLEYYHLK